MIVNVTGVPEQFRLPLLNVGVTVMVDTTGAPPLLTAVNDAISPVPEAARPVVVLLFVQLNTVPGTVPLNVTAVVALPLHNTWLLIPATVGVGFTLMLNSIGVPVQVTPLFV